MNTPAIESEGRLDDLLSEPTAEVVETLGRWAGDADWLPDAPLVLDLVGRKFGSTGDEAATWAVNGYRC
jgi:hypothetical protein